MFKAILFDMDGTITDTEKIYNKAWVRAHHECGYEDYTKEDALSQRSLNHKDSEVLWRHRYGDSYDWSSVHDKVTAYVNEAIDRDGIEVKPGLDELLNCLKTHGIKAAVVTATNLQAAHKRLGLAGIEDRFDIIISASQVKQGKPHPDVYLYAVSQLGLTPEDCLAVEDSPNGVKSAVGAGCPTIMVPDLAEPDEETAKLLYAKCERLDGIIEIIES